MLEVVEVDVEEEVVVMEELVDNLFSARSFRLEYSMGLVKR